MPIAYIALGSNLNDPARKVSAARLALGGIPQTKLVKASSLYLSQPVDASGDDYVNAVVKLDTELSAEALLAALQALEQQAGRPAAQQRRHQRNEPRVLDLDILLYGQACIHSEQLTVPHPRMWQRAFVLRPLHEIAPELVSPQQLAQVSAQVIQQLPETSP